MTKRRGYTGTSDGVSPGRREGTEKLKELIRKRYGLGCLGTWVVRDRRGKPGQLSVHATGRALDIYYVDRDDGLYVMDWLVAHADALGVEFIGDYLHGRFGRGWRCDRGKWQTYRVPSIGKGGRFFHLEISPTMADDPVTLERVFRALPK
jgi:hypothetical protein